MSHRIFSTAVADVYPHYVAKAERKDRSEGEVREIIRWLTGYSDAELDRHLSEKTTFKVFFAQAPEKNPNRELITGSVCGVKVQEVEDPLMREIRYMDKLVEELARGKAMEKILRKPKE